MARALPQPRLPEIGRIRLGTRERTSKGKLVPTASPTLVMSSPSKGTLVQLAARVGGSVSAWEGGPEPWRLVSETAQIAALLSPSLLGEPRWELWSAAGLQRRCDGETCEVPVDAPDGPLIELRPCMCTAEDAECRITTRVAVVLPQVPGIGVWLTTTHSAIAASELAGQRALLGASGSASLLPCTLAIEHERTRRGATVPVIRLRFHVGLDALANASPAGALSSGDA